MTERPGELRSHRQQDGTLLLDYGGPVVAISIPHEGIARIRLAATGTFKNRQSWSPLSPEPDLDPPPVEVHVDGGGAVELSSELLTVRAEPSGARVCVTERSTGRALLRDGPEDGPSWQEDGSAAWAHEMPWGEHYFGLGNRTGVLDKRGRCFEFWTTDRFEVQGAGTNELYQAIPFYLAMDEEGRAHGLFLNNTHRCQFDLSDELNQRQVIRVTGGEVDQYVIAGPTPAEVLERYTRLTGRPTLPPRWAFGYQQACWGYSSAKEIKEIAQRLRAVRMPADVIYIDIERQDGYRVFTWNRERFPDPAGLIRELREMGFRVGLVLSVGVKYQPEGGYDVYTEGAERGYFLPEGDGPLLRHLWPGLAAFPDFSRPEVRAWWGNLYESAVADGARVFVNDMNEPSMRSGPIMEPSARLVSPPGETAVGPMDERTTYAEVHNIYGDLEDRAADEALRRFLPDERHLLVTRAGFAGTQRLAATWTGDNASYWEHMEMSLPQLLNLGLSGMPFAGADIGGFYADCQPELLARWFQLGAFYPIAKQNNAKPCRPQEPWVFGPEIEATCRRALELRYRMLPYLYTVAAEASRSGAPMFRPLLYHFGRDREARFRDDEALIGRDVLIAPVFRPGRVQREVYLPSGLWYDLRDGGTFHGKRSVLADAPLDRNPPMFARGGAILPFGPVMQWTEERPLDPLDLHVFPDDGGVATGELYEDDGISRGHERGEYAITRYAYRDGVLTSRREGGYEPPPRRVRIWLHSDGPPFTHELAHDEPEWTVQLR